MPRGRSPKAVIAIPCEAIKLAGAKTLLFPSIKICADYFGTDIANIWHALNNDIKKIPTCGFYFDYMV